MAILRITADSLSDPRIQSALPIVYKHMEKRWADEFVSGKSVLLGTLDDFRNTERHQLNRGDEHEGSVSFADPEPNAIDNSPGIRRQMETHGYYLRGNQIEGFASQISVEVPNHLILCFTMSDDFTVSEELDNGYDTVVRVGNIFSLLVSITRAIGDAGLEVTHAPSIGSVVYQRRVVGRNGILDPDCFIKDTVFARQREYRLAWHVAGEVKPMAVAIDASGCNLSIVER